MPEKVLTSVQRAALLALMIKAGPLENRFLEKNAKIALKKTPYRQDLVDLNLITVTGKPYLTLELTEKGWGWAVQELSAPVPAGAGALGGALYLLLDKLRQHFESSNLSAAEFFAPNDGDLDSRLRKAYAELASGPGAWVTLADLRDAVGDASRSSVDAALLRLDGESDIDLIPESNQKSLTAAQRAAAVRIGNQDMHLLAIGL